MTSPRLQQLLNLLEESPEDSFLLFAIAKEYEKIDNLELALSYFQKLINLDPNYVGTYYHLGKLYEQLEKVSLALSIYEQGIVIAKSLKDQHALSELMGVKMNLELDM